jgi:hypothetical protein
MMSAPSSKDPALADHLAWLGYVQPEGLVVSAPALVDAQAIIDRAQLGDLQRRFAEQVASLRIEESDTGETSPGIADLAGFLRDFLGWPEELLQGLDPSRPLPPDLTVSLPEFGEILAPTFAVARPPSQVRSTPSANGNSQWLLLVQSHPAAVDLDRPAAASDRHWHASPAKKFERLLRETGVTIGLLTNGTCFRLIYTPPKENSGAITFPVGAMGEVSGRLILGAFQLLLGSWTLFNAPSEARLPALLQRSRDYQASVSEILAEQVLHALYELLRGFETAEDRAQSKFVRDLAARSPGDIYGGLVTVLLRLVFILFAEDRGLLPASGLYVRHYAVRGLFERLRADAERYPDTMDHRFGAWAQLLALFRVIHGGCKHTDLAMPARAGHLFDPDRYPFLEGRASDRDPIGALPLVSDGTLHRILEKLCILEGERVSYRTLDVEEIGSVYQTIMGFGVEIAAGTSIALKGKRKNGGVPAPVAISLEQLLAIPAKDRAKWLKENADTELTGESDKRLKSAATVDDLLVALEKRVDRHATPAPVAQGGHILQPTDERRRSGSHYTPRSFTEPIVRKTLEPILKRFGEQPTPAQILDLKICDIAVGSAAFLVETCRQLADVLVKSWRTHGGRPALPPDETEELLAMRMIAQRCLYGVDRNPMAVDLAKLSLWLATLAKDHPFTFLDHAIRCGDSLVGLTRKQIEDFTWRDTKTTERQFFATEVRKRTAAALRERQNLLGLGDDYTSPQLKRDKLEKADELLDLVRFIGDAAVAAFFAADKDKARETKRAELAERIAEYLDKGDLKQRPTDEVKALRGGQFPVIPFHWEVEYPEVFDRSNPGFDAIVGNPPFLGGLRVSNMLGMQLFAYLTEANPGAGHLCDLVAYFFRKAFGLLRATGSLGLVATNSIAQGDTRTGGLSWICEHGGEIYSAVRRQRWPGQAAVIVSILHLSKGSSGQTPILDQEPVSRITAYLFTHGGNLDPSRLAGMNALFSQGTNIRSPGFLIGDGGEPTTNSEIDEVLQRSAVSRIRIFPYLGGEDINSHPAQEPHRRVIYLSDIRDEGELAKWPELTDIVRRKVKPERDALGSNPNNIPLKRRWWAYHADRLDFYTDLERLLVLSQVGAHCAFTFQPANRIFGNTLNLFRIPAFSGFSVLQSRTHEGWVRFFASTMKDDLRYTPSDCFETFPFPVGFETNAALEAVGREYYEFRAALMQDLWLGLTEIYNLFHSPDDEALARLEALYRKRAASSEWRAAEKVPADRSPLTAYPSPASALDGVRRLRELHAAMDAAVLTAYGWTDLLLRCTCEFLLDYEDDDSESGEESGGRRKKKPWRYRWPDEVRDEVLARLLKLNAERAEEERIAGLRAGGDSVTPGKPRSRKGAPRSAANPSTPAPGSTSQPDLFS